MIHTGRREDSVVSAFIASPFFHRSLLETDLIESTDLLRISKFTHLASIPMLFSYRTLSLVLTVT